MAKNILISVVILNYNGLDFLEDCLSSVLHSDYPFFEIIFVDNGSTDGSINYVEALSRSHNNLKIIKNKVNSLFTGGNNIGIRQAQGEYIIVLNNDTIVDRRCLNEIAQVMADERVGAAQPKIYAHNGRDKMIDHIGGRIDKCGYAKAIGCGEPDTGQYDALKEVFYACGAAFVAKRKVLDEVGLFDEKFGMHWEDTDLSWRIRLRGYKIVPAAKAIIYHKGSKTMFQFVKRPDIAWYIRKNRIAGLIKNYGIGNLLIYLPVLLGTYILMFLKEAIIDRNIRLALSSIYAILWNFKEMPYLLKKRKFIQKSIRKVPDREIIKFMEKRYVAIGFGNHRKS